MKTKRFSWKLLLLCAIPFVPLLAVTSRDVAYRVASSLWPPLREGLSYELKNSVHVKGDLKTIKQLVARGADVNHARYGWPPLANAIAGQRTDLALFLVQSGANPNFRVSTNGSTLLYKAATELNSPPLVREMLRRGAAMKSANGSNEVPLLVSALFWGKNQTARVLIEAGADVNESAHAFGMNRTALMMAAEKGDVKLIEMLLKHGADVNAQVTSSHNKGNTALMFAAHKQNANVVEMLLKHGANPNLVPQKRFDDTSQSALLQAVVNYMGQPQKLSPDQRRMIRALLAHGANVNLGNEYSMPLQSVSSRFAPDVVREFLKRGAKVNWQNVDGWSALMSAASVGDLQTVKLLLQAGANKSLRDEDGKTALYWARREKHLDVVRVLE